MGTDSPAVRKAATADLQRIQEIAVAAWTPIYEHRRRHVLGDDIFNDLWGAWRQTWRVTPESIDRAIVTELGGKIIGFATWRILGPKAGEIMSNAIDPPFQGRRLGVRQIKSVIEILKEHGCECANVFTGLDPAHGPARGQYYALGLTLPLTTSVYMNYVSAVPSAPMLAGVEVRPGRPEDSAALMEIVDSVWPPIFEENNGLTSGFFGVCFPNALSDKKQAVSKRLAESPQGVLVASNNGQVPAFCLLDLDQKTSSGTIRLLGVSPSARHKGAATALGMEAARLLRERGLRYLWLKAEAGENTEAARGLCHKLGLHREIPSVWLFGPI